MSSIRDRIKQEENVKTRAWNGLFITDVHTHTVHVQQEAFYAVETLQQPQFEDGELQRYLYKWRWSFISRTLFPTCSSMWTSPPPC